MQIYWASYHVEMADPSLDCYLIGARIAQKRIIDFATDSKQAMKSGQ